MRFMAREILILRRLDHPNVMTLRGLVTSRMSCSLYLVFDYMDHDLAGLAASPGIKFTEAQVGVIYLYYLLVDFLATSVWLPNCLHCFLVNICRLNVTCINY